MLPTSFYTLPAKKINFSAIACRCKQASPPMALAIIHSYQYMFALVERRREHTCCDKNTSNLRRQISLPLCLSLPVREKKKEKERKKEKETTYILLHWHTKMKLQSRSKEGIQITDMHAGQEKDKKRNVWKIKALQKTVSIYHFNIQNKKKKRRNEQSFTVLHTALLLRTCNLASLPWQWQWRCNSLAKKVKGGEKRLRGRS